MRTWALLLCWLLTACASTPSIEPRWEWAEAGVAECDDPGADRCTTLVCAGKVCGFYHCEDVAPGRIEPAQAMAPMVRPLPPEPMAEPFPTPANPQRYWGNAQGLPRNAEPVFVIPWDQPKSASRTWAQPEASARKQEGDKDSGKRTWVKHHIFPQEFKGWFELQGINIHEVTMVLEKAQHERIHRGSKGGPWNAAWRQYIKATLTPTPEGIRQFAGELIFRFGLTGPLQPYYRPTLIPGVPTEEETY